MRDTSSKKFLILVLTSLCLMFSVTTARAQCGADGTQPCKTSAKTVPKKAKKAAPKVIARKSNEGKICGNPRVRCKTGDVSFERFEIPFEVPKNAVISSSETFYAVILRSRPFTDESCSEYLSEENRLELQSLFPDNKVFVFRCDEFDTIYYTGVTENVGFMAVYGGRTLKEAQIIWNKVKATGLFTGTNIRKIQAEFNGT